MSVVSVIPGFRVEADISEDGKHIEVLFDYDAYIVQVMRSIRIGRFIPPEKGGPLWRFPLDIDVGRELRKHLGEQFRPSPRFKKWAMRQQSVALTLRSLSSGDSAELERLPEYLEELSEAIHLGPIGLSIDAKERKEKLNGKGSFQTADVAFMAACPAPINANQPGTGKTLETIASVFEEGIEGGPKMVVAPLTSLEAVWEKELLAWQYQDVILCFGSKARRDDAVAAATAYVEAGDPFWFITNPDNIRKQANWEVDPVSGKRTGKKKMWDKYPSIFEIDWGLVVLDEFQRFGLANDTLTQKGLNDLTKKKGLGLSGTPIKGKPINLWGILHFLAPHEFPSKWKFAEQWLVISQGSYGKQIGDVRKEKEEAFWEMIGKYMIRRTKEEVLPWLPPKQRIDIWATLEGQQKKQYETFAMNAEIKIEEEHLSATSILAEYTRLKQFAIATQRIEPQKDPPYFAPFPEVPSCKLPHVEEILRELGIILDKATKEDLTGELWDGEQVVIFSQFTRVVNWLAKWLNDVHGVRVAVMTGETPGPRRNEIFLKFQGDDEDRPQVIIMNTTAGGVSITLDKADTVIFMDETWVPDDQEQAEDRVHRGSRIHNVKAYYIRTKDTIEEYIHQRVAGKENINKRILDLRREGLRATGDKK